MATLLARVNNLLIEEDHHERIQLRVEGFSPALYMSVDEAEALFVTLDYWLVSKGR